MTRIEAIKIATKMHAALGSLQSESVPGNFFIQDPFSTPIFLDMNGPCT